MKNIDRNGQVYYTNVFEDSDVSDYPKSKVNYTRIVVIVFAVVFLLSGIIAGVSL
jgi:hypothetical protein